VRRLLATSRLEMGRGFLCGVVCMVFHCSNLYLGRVGSKKQEKRRKQKKGVAVECPLPSNTYPTPTSRTAPRHTNHRSIEYIIVPSFYYSPVLHTHTSPRSSFVFPPFLPPVPPSLPPTLSPSLLLGHAVDDVHATVRQDHLAQLAHFQSKGGVCVDDGNGGREGRREGGVEQSVRA